MSRVYRLERETLVDMHGDERRPFNELVEGIRVEVVRQEDRLLEFDLVNVDCSVANALRRILISEVPTMAVRSIVLSDNDSVFPDEFLAHRLGLVPLHVDPEMFEDAGEALTERNSLRFILSVENSGKDVLNVYSDDIRWSPLGDQRDVLGDVGFAQRVLLFKLAPKQKISAELVCTKGIGKDHAKWSPVCPATYRLMPVIEIGDVFDEEALKLQKCFSAGVIEVRPADGRMKAFVANARLDSMSREAMRHREFEGRVFIGRRADHFLFSVQSTHLNPMYLLKKAVSILIEKSRLLMDEVDCALEY